MEQTQMMDNTNHKESSWFADDGPYNDVVLSTRVRIARNLDDFLFPSKMNEDDIQRVNSLIYDAFLSETNYHFLKVNDISKTGIQILKDKNILSKKEAKCIVLDTDDESVSCVVNETDHLKISAFTSGLDTETAMKKVYKIDELLQHKLQFAASFEFGYLTSRIKDCGSGMKISIRLFIPSIILAGKFDSVLSLVQEKKLVLKPIFKSEYIADFSNCIFDLCNSNAREGNEFDQMVGIQSIATVILKTERKIRQELTDNNNTVVLNFFKQSFARAMYSLLLSYEESVSIISAVKWGVQLGLVSGITESELNALYFRTKSGHLKYLCDNFAFTFENDIVSNEKLKLKRLRTIVIQQAFEGIINEKTVS